MRRFKLVSYLIAALSMNYYRLMKSQAYFEFSGNQPIELADQPDIVPYGAKHIWIPAGNGDEISAWLVTPKGKFLLQDDCFPIVVMAPGFGNQKDMGLLQFAEEFSEGGIAALMFDYRLFGGSSRRNSKMRNYVNPWHHVEDIVTVVNYIHSNKLESDNVDPKNIALWGAAYGGGHVIVAAEQLGSTMIKGIVAQAPFLDGRAAAWKAFRHGGVFRTIDFVTLAITDVLRNMIGMHPLYVKIISQNKTDISFITAKPQDLTEYYAKHPKKYLGGWENKAPARSFFSLSFYSPKNHVGNIEVPILFITSDIDELSPQSVVKECSEKTRHENSTLVVRHGLSHFSYYAGNEFRGVASLAKDFMKSKLFLSRANYFETANYIK